MVYHPYTQAFLPVSSSESEVKAVQRQFLSRSILPLHRDSVWQVQRGVVRTMTWLEDGTIVVLGLWGAGDVIPSVATRIDPYQAECLSKVEAVSLAVGEWRDSASSMQARIQQIEELMIIRSYKRADEMLLKLLAWLVKRFGREVDQGQLIDLRLTHQDLADILGITRVTITRLLSQFERQGMIERLPLHRIVLKEEDLWYYEI